MSDEKCPICGKMTEDMRHVSVECFYDVHEVVPEAKLEQHFIEVDPKGTYWGITRTYSNGKRDDFSAEEVKTEKNTTRIINSPTEITGIRLMEIGLYRMNCCKSCRADFLEMLEQWYHGKHKHQDKGNGRIPVRIKGATRFVTEEEYQQMLDKNIKAAKK